MKISEMVSKLLEIKDKEGDLEICVGDLDKDGVIILLQPDEPKVSKGRSAYIIALAPLGCFGDDE